MLLLASIVGCVAESRHKTDRASQATIQSILRPPLDEGGAGYKKTLSILGEVGVQEKYIAEGGDTRLSQEGRLTTLADGYVLESIEYYERTGLHMRLKNTPCLTIDRLAAITGANLKPPFSPTIQDGLTVRSFYVDRNGITISFATPGPNYRCVSSITIFLV